MRALPIRARLTLWYFCFFALAALALSASYWLLLHRSLETFAKHELEERLDDIQSLLSSQPQDATLEQIRSVIFVDYHQKDEGKWLQIIDQDGNWIYRSARSRVTTPIGQLTDEPAVPFAFVARPGHRLQTLSRKSFINGRLYFLSMAMSTDKSDRLLAEFRRDLIITVPLVILMAACAGHFLSRKALNPVAAIATEARRITDRNLAARLPVLESGDEIEHLSITLNQMLERIENAFRSVRAFTANASHELRTPVALIRTRADVALCFPRSAEYYRDVLQQVQHESEGMTALIEDLLAFARADAGAEKFELQSFDLTELIAEVAQEWAARAEQLSLYLTVDNAGQPIAVLGNRPGLLRLLRVLMDNACQYTPAGGAIHLDVQTNFGHAKISVRDTGIGIAAEHLPHIFDRFYRVPHVPNQNRGTGLGLALAQWIAEQHHTSISVESKPGQGSVFSFTLPTLPSGRSHLEAGRIGKMPGTVTTEP